MEPITWEALGMAAVGRLAEIPQVLFVVVLEGLRIYRSNGGGFKELIEHEKKINGWVALILLGWALLKALPAIIITSSIFWVRL